MMGKWLTRTVFILSMVSLLNDMAGEMLYPVIPIYLTSIGYGAVWIGILEGVAEAVSGYTRGWFGEWSDKAGVRLPFIRIGYFLSAISKPALTFIASPVWALFTRTSDRFGKGIRTGARDAMLATETHSDTRGRVFGFHRAMDTTGAFIGPVIALLWIASHPAAQLHTLFYLALIPGLVSVAFLFLLKEKKSIPLPGKLSSPFRAFTYWNKASRQYRRLIFGLLLLAFMNSSDMFILLRIRRIFPDGYDLFGHHFNPDMLVVAFYVFYNLVYAVFSYPAGSMSDRFGPKKMITTGYVFFAFTYFSLGLLQPASGKDVGLMILMFFMYGLYYAFTEGVSRSWVSQMCAREDKGKALGLFSALTSFAVLSASVSAGVIWKFVSEQLVFILPACFAVISIVYLTFVTRDPLKKSTHE